MTDAENPENAVRFADLGLPEERLRTLDALGFEHPTPIQEQSIPVLLEGRDVVGIAQTGTGKTAAFGLPLLGRVDPDTPATQALVLAPTRELALQTTTALKALAGRDSGIRIITVYGGASYVPQLRALREGTQIVVGTPGRIIDLIDRGSLDLSSVNTLVLDEADEMLRMGFAEEVDTILQNVPEERLTALYSATMPSVIAKVAKQHLKDPVRIEASSPSSTVDTIHQTYALVPPKLRFEALARFLSISSAGAAIVFVRTRKDAEEISLNLSARGFRASGISGDIAQRERERLLDGLRRGYLDVLVATDVAARGIDVDRVGLVVNYEAPLEPEQYVHRIGRTGRAGRTGESLTLFTPRDQRKLRQIERVTGTKINHVAVPTATEVRTDRALTVLTRALERPEPASEAVVKLLEAQRDAGLRYRDIAATLLSAAAQPRSLGEASVSAQDRFDEQFSSVETTARRDGGRRDGRREGSRKDREPFRAKDGYTRKYRIEVGKRDGAKAGAIVGAITGEAGLRGSNVGKIDIFPSFSVVELDSELSTSQMKKLDKATVRGRRLHISVDRGAKRSEHRSTTKSGSSRSSSSQVGFSKKSRSRR